MNLFDWLRDRFPKPCDDEASPAERRYERAAREAEATIRHADRVTEQARKVARAPSWDGLFGTDGGRGDDAR